MVNVDCAGGQDRNTTTSETQPHTPPRKTKNCYLSDPLNTVIGFDSSLCGSSGDRACSDIGSILDCKPDNYGGYCKVGNKYYVSQGSRFIELTKENLLDRYKEGGNTDETGREVNRALNDQDRKFTNRIRELQIMGKDPLVQRSGSKKEDDSGVNSFASDLFTKIGIGISVIIFIISVCIILIQNKII